MPRSAAPSSPIGPFDLKLTLFPSSLLQTPSSMMEYRGIHGYTASRPHPRPPLQASPPSPSSVPRRLVTCRRSQPPLGGLQDRHWHPPCLVADCVVDRVGGEPQQRGPAMPYLRQQAAPLQPDRNSSSRRSGTISLPTRARRSSIASRSSIGIRAASSMSTSYRQLLPGLLNLPRCLCPPHGLSLQHTLHPLPLPVGNRGTATFTIVDLPSSDEPS